LGNEVGTATPLLKNDGSYNGKFNVTFFSSGTSYDVKPVFYKPISVPEKQLQLVFKTHIGRYIVWTALTTNKQKPNDYTLGDPRQYEIELMEGWGSGCAGRKWCKPTSLSKKKKISSSNKTVSKRLCLEEV